MKTREIEVWVKRRGDECGTPYIVYFPNEPTPGDAIKAKLVVPVEPEIIETTVEWKDSDDVIHPTGILPSGKKWNELIGRKFRMRLEEIIENESLNLK